MEATTRRIAGTSPAGEPAVPTTSDGEVIVLTVKGK